MNPKISIIMPVYNAEKYLSEMIDSIINQTFTDFELIALNDGSTDDSLSILQSYSNRDTRICVIDKPNTGVSDTRNLGLGNAQGEYVCFVDADDVLLDDYLSVLYGVAIENDADMVVCGYSTFRSSLPHDDVSFEIRLIKSSEELSRNGLLTGLWIKLFKRNVLIDNSIGFSKDLSFGEDLFFCWKAFLVSKKTFVTTKKLYAYRLTGMGAISKYHPCLYEKYKNAFMELKEFAEIRGNDTEVRLIDYFWIKRIPILMMMIARGRQQLNQKIRDSKIVLSDDVTADTLDSCWNDFSKTLNSKEIKLFKSARNGNALYCLFYGYKLNLKMKLSSLKGKFGGS